MKKALYIIGLITLSVTSCKQSDPVPKELELVWSDEFDGNSLDLNKWEIQTGNGSAYGLYNWGNEEEQWYTEDNITVFQGKLNIRAQTETVQQGYDFTSARIRSLNKADFQYGRIEASIKMDATQGLWHAFWMLPSSEEASWPETGEIDIMEYVGNQPNQVFGTVHFADPFGNHSFIGEEYPFVPGDDFHVYAVEWDENGITWFIDDVQTFSLDRTDDRISSTWPFDADFHLLLNTAVGGLLGGNVNTQDLVTPQLMQVQYVRVYQEK